MKKISILFFFLVIFHFGHSQSIKVMLVTGGHSFDSLQFFQLFDSFDDIEYEHFAQPRANAEIAHGTANDFDVLVFYDMWKEISSAEKSAYLKLTKQGKPFLFLHHSLASYQNWPEFEKLIGGKYLEMGRDIPAEDLSTYEHDVWLYCTIENYTPVTSGFSELRFFDEVYGNIRIADDVTPLLRTRHPKSSEFVAWQHVYNKSNVVYIQSGHDRRTFESKDYRKLLLQAIKYLSATN